MIVANEKALTIPYIENYVGLAWLGLAWLGLAWLGACAKTFSYFQIEYRLINMHQELISV